MTNEIQEVAAYVELQVTTCFSFLRGASHPAEIVLRARQLGLAAIAITDRNSLAGVVRAHAAAKQLGIRLLVGARLDFTDAPSLLVFPCDRAAYGELSELLTKGKLAAKKGGCRLSFGDCEEMGGRHQIVALPPDRLDVAYERWLPRLTARFGTVSLAAHHHYRGDDQKRIARLARLAERAGTPLVATNDVEAHVAERRPLQDVLTCIRERCTLAEAGFRLPGNAERHLKSPAEIHRLFRRWPEAIRRGLEIAAASRFSLDELAYEYPMEPVPAGLTPHQTLEALVETHAAERYPGGVPPGIAALLQRELRLVADLDYARYFLTVYDIVRAARERGILCQGRGSAANSAVCFVLGITAVDPAKVDLLFERFVSTERGEPPDIDVDFEHERREEVIQYIYEKYGRDRAAIVATVTTYRPKSALRDVGKAFGLGGDTLDLLSRSAWEGGSEAIDEAHLRQCGLDPGEPILAQVLVLARELLGFPRHLSQHSGGFVISGEKLSRLMPIAPAAMPGRTMIEWDKEDLSDLGMMKIDVLGLGALTFLRKALALLCRHHGVSRALYEIADEDPAVYDMLCRGDSLGIFQLESRAQMSMLPRLRPRSFYDLVVQVAIVRPGPIVGDMVHPYLRGRDGKLATKLPGGALAEVLGRTHGVPLFQEQAMRIAIVAAGFTPAEANALRRAIGGYRGGPVIEALKARFLAGMRDHGYAPDFAVRCFRLIEAFGDYGFPESHAASFALLVYASAWIKCHYPAVFACATLNSQPMGFYAPAQILRDARDHGVEVRPVDANRSDWDCTLEAAGGGFALRLGLREISGFAERDARRLIAARGARDFGSLPEAWRRTGLGRAAMEQLAGADAWGSLNLRRRPARWTTSGLEPPLPLFDGLPARELEPALPEMSVPEEVGEDYRHLRLSLRQHPMLSLRPALRARGLRTAAELAAADNRERIAVAGLVVVRQQPATAGGILFITLEDESGFANVIVHPGGFRRFRAAVLGGEVLAVRGTVQREPRSGVVHLIAEEIGDLSATLHAASLPAGVTQQMLSRSDQLRRPDYQRRETGGRSAPARWARACRSTDEPNPSG